MRLIPKFLEAAVGNLFAKPEAPVANLETVTSVKGGAGQVVYVAFNRYGGGAMSSAGGSSERFDLNQNETGGWELVKTSRHTLHKQDPKTETVGRFATLEEGVPHLRAVSDRLKEKYSGFFAAAAGYSYSEGEHEDGLKAVERAIALKNQTAATPAPAPRA